MKNNYKLSKKIGLHKNGLGYMTRDATILKKLGHVTVGDTTILNIYNIINELCFIYNYEVS